MGFRLPDLILESVIREGLTSIRRDSTILDDMFKDQLTTELGSLMAAKYGEKELTRIKDFFAENEISFVGAFSQVMTNLPCFSIQLMDDSEAQNLARMSDEEQDTFDDFTEPDEIADLIRVSDVDITDYDPLTGTCYIDDSVDLTDVLKFMILEDIDGNEFLIYGGIVETAGSKQIVIRDRTGSATPDEDGINITGPAIIKSSIDFVQKERRGTTDNQKLLIGVHTEDRLLTIYLYLALKYFITSRKDTLITRGFDLASYTGSDFTRNVSYVEPVFDRFLTVSGIVENNWASDKVTPIEAIEVDGTPEDFEDTE